MGFAQRKQLENTVTWTRSRNAVLRECRRKYWLKYYGSWQGWNYGTRRQDPEARQAYILSKMQNRYMWAGVVVHAVIANALGSSPPWSLNDLLMDAKKRILTGIGDSMQRRWEGDPKRCLNLAEHFYKIPLEKDGAIRKRIVRAIEAAHEWISQNLESVEIRGVEEPVHKETPEGVPYMGILDLVFQREEGLNVIDWKTGRPKEEDREQALLYVMAAKDHYGAPTESIRVEMVYLLTGQVSTFSATDDELEELRKRMLHEAEEFYKIHRDPDVLKNQKTEDLSTCADCFFRAMCGR